MFRLALKSTLANKRRLFSTALSVILGVAFLTGTFVFTDTIKRTFDDLFATVYAGTDSFVRSSSAVELEQGGDQRGRIPETVLDTVAGVDGVVDVRPMLTGFAQLVGADGEAIGDPGRGAPTFGMNYFGGNLSPWRLTQGSYPPGPGEIVVDVRSAEVGDFEVGESVTVLTQNGPHELTLVGTTQFGSIDSPGGASVSLFDLSTAQEVLAAPGLLDGVMVDGARSLSQEELTSRIEAVLPDGAEALTGAEITKESQDTMREAMSFFNTFMLVFAVIGLVVACFTIYNTFQIIVTQRTREMALLRSVGATRRQVLWAQLLEAVVLGIIASAVGLATGVLVASGLKAMLQGFGIDIPAGGTVFSTRTALVALAVGITVTIVSATFPAIRASRVPPLAAVRDVAVDVAAQSRRRLVEGGVVTMVGVTAFVAGLAGQGILWVGVGTLVTFVGVFVLAPLIARPASSALGWPLPKVSGVTGDLARENAMRNPKRTARTGGALMVGVALVAAITVIAAAAKDWTRDVFGEQFTGDAVVSTTTYGFGGLSPDVAAQLNELAEVAAAAGIRVGAARDVETGSDTMYIAVDPATASRVFDIGVVEGDLALLSSTGIFVEDGEAADRSLRVGDSIEFAFLDGSTRPLIVEGTYTEDDLAGTFVVSHALHEQTGVDQFDFSVYIVTAEGVSEADAMTAIASVSDAYPNAELQTREEYIDAQAAQLDQIVNLMYALLALAVLIALLNIANSMSLSIHERTHELGLLRAVGMTRRQTAAAVRWEAMLIALLGSGLGIALGVGFGWAISVVLRDEGPSAVSIPVVSMAVIVAIGVLGGVTAALRPGRRAARLDVLRAIASQ
jgi:putative ABC transport system permease protein